MYLHHTPGFVQNLFPSFTWKKPSDSAIYLTFDDGPIPEVTPLVLEILRRYQARATFFCVGDNIKKYPQVLQEVVLNGHKLGNHTHHHVDGWSSSVSRYQEEVKLCQAALEPYQINDARPLFRPPYGRMKPAQWRNLRSEFEIVMWDVLSADFSQSLSGEACLRNTLRHTKPGSIVVFHDSLKSWKRLGFVLPRFLHYFSSRGYNFEAL